MRFSRTRISPSFADICTPVLRYPRNDLTGRASEFCLKSFAGAGVWTTADGAKHRWPKIVQVERGYCQGPIFRRNRGNWRIVGLLTRHRSGLNWSPKTLEKRGRADSNIVDAACSFRYSFCYGRRRPRGLGGAFSGTTFSAVFK